MAHLRPVRSRWHRRRALPAAAPRPETPSTRSCRERPSTRRPLPSPPANCPSGRPPAGWFERKQERGRQARARRQVRGGSLRRPPVRRLAFGKELSRQRNQLAAIFDGVDQRIEAPDQEVADAEVVIVA